jgi:anti-anti-sigma factor
VDVAAVDLDAVDQPELDEVEAELRVDHVRERGFDLFDGDHAASLAVGATRPAGVGVSFQGIVSLDEHAFVLRVYGDEDRTTQGLRRGPLSRALSRARADLTVDLSELQFADASLMLDLAVLARRLRRAGKCLRIEGARPHIQRLIEIVGIDRLPGVLVATPAR